MEKSTKYDNREDNLLTFKINLIPYLMKVWNNDNFEISAILEKYHLLSYIDASYEIYNTMGVQGVLQTV